MDNIKETSLKKCLEQIPLMELPKQIKGNGAIHWIEAIILVRKMDYSLSYVLAKRGADGKVVYMADFGHLSPIKAIISIHPYIILDKKRFFPYNDVQEMRDALIAAIGGDDVAIDAVGKLSDFDVEYQLLNNAIQLQYAELVSTGSTSNVYFHDVIEEEVTNEVLLTQDSTNSDNANSTQKDTQPITIETQEKIEEKAQHKRGRKPTKK